MTSIPNAIHHTARTRPSPSFQPIAASSLKPLECFSTPWYLETSFIGLKMIVSALVGVNWLHEMKSTGLGPS